MTKQTSLGRSPNALKKLQQEQNNLHQANIISQRLRLARDFHLPEALTADQLVTRILHNHQLDIDKNAIHKIETQRRNVYDYEIKVFAQILEVSADWLLGLTDKDGPRGNWQEVAR